MAPFISVPSANCVDSHAQKHCVEVKSHYSDPYWHPMKDVHVCLRLKMESLKQRIFQCWLVRLKRHMDGSGL